jgi:AcrR family transcriptional regulator
MNTITYVNSEEVRVKTRLTRHEQKAATRAYSRGAFYANFVNKEECFLELLAGRSSAHLTGVASAFAEENTLEDRLCRSADFLAALVRREREWCQLYVEALSLASRDDQLRRRMSNQYREWRAYVADIITQEFEAPRPSKAHAQVLASALIALFEGFILQQLVDPDAHSRDHLARMLALLMTTEHPLGHVVGDVPD